MAPVDQAQLPAPTTYLRRSWPALVTLGACLAVVLVVLASSDWDALELARLGTRYAEGDPEGSAGYDGQFAYYIALDLRPKVVSARLDVPAYRYQRILYPLLARLASGGRAEAIPWALLGVNLAAHAAGAWLVSELLAQRGVARGYALTYGLWVGFVYAVRLDLNEPLAYALVAGGLWAWARGKVWTSALLYGLALFAKETTLIFFAAQCLACLLAGRLRQLARMAAAGLGPFLLFQAWLYLQFGSPGLSSGGDLATPFEVLPYRGFWQIADSGWGVFLLFAATFGLSLVLPSIWGVLASGRRLLSSDRHHDVLALLANAGIMAFVPFSTYREPLGVTRFACGLVLAIMLFGAHTGSRRILNYSLFWIPMLVMLVNG